MEAGERLNLLLLAALRAAPRRYRMPSLPADARAAAAAGHETALAFALEAARTASAHGLPLPEAVAPVFTQALAALIGEALAPGAGDPAFQALVLRTQDADVDEHVRLAAQHVVDRRAVRAVLDAVAHPGKLHDLPDPSVRDALTRLHALAGDGAWTRLAADAPTVLARPGLDEDVRSALEAMLGHAALRRLARAEALRTRAAVQRYQALCERRGPAAGSPAAAAQGRAAARTGDHAEEDTLRAFHAVAQLLQARGGDRYRAVARLRTPRGFPGAADKAKDEWDAAILRGIANDAGADIVLLAEVKAAPAAATPDYARLLRGLQRLASASEDAVHAFPSADGELRIRGASLRALAPGAAGLPPHVVYCSSAIEGQVQMLSAASKAVLLSEPASLAHAHALTRGEVPHAASLAAVWEALPRSPQLRSALNQYETARIAREAMLHPQDLLDALRTQAGSR